MRILVTADLHYDIPRSREPTEQLARQAVSAGGDAIVLVGDTAGADLEIFRRALRLFAEFPGRRFLVPGNHCLWCMGEETSLDRYERLIPRLAGEEGFGVLDHEPAVLEGPIGRKVGLVGSIGWYDYSLRIESLDVPEDFYRAKVAPGAAAYFTEHRELLERHAPSLGERQRAMTTRWMDGQYVRLGMSDEEFVERLADKLRRQLEQLRDEVDRIVAFVHHLPFAELVPRDRPDRFAFVAAYMGSARLGEALLACPKVTHVYCGHSHWGDRRRIGHVDVVNVGSTYVDKKLLTLEL